MVGMHALMNHIGRKGQQEGSDPLKEEALGVVCCLFEQNASIGV